jgi:mycothiol synthase
MHESQASPSALETPPLRAPTTDDAPRILALLHACEFAAHGEADSSLADLHWTWSLPRFDLARNAAMVTDAAGEAIGYAVVGARGDGVTLDGDVVVHPQHRAGELGARLVAFVERRAAELVSGAASGELALPAPRTDRDACALLERHGFHVGREFFRMEIALGDEAPRYAMPTGLALRPFRLGKDDSALHETMEESFARHFRFVAQPCEEWIRRRTTIDIFDPALWLLAWDGERLAGAVLGYPEPANGFIGELGVRPPWRHRGLGRALLFASFAAFHARGERRVALGVDAANADGATHLYESAGMRATRHLDTYLKRVNRAT